MCANEREELLRPGLSGGGGGKPLDCGATPTAGATFAAVGAAAPNFCAAFATTGLAVLTALAGFKGNLALALTCAFTCVFGSDFGALFGAGLTGVFVFITGFFVDFTFAAGLPTGLTAAFFTAFDAGLPAALTAGFLTAFFGEDFGEELASGTFFVGDTLEAVFASDLAAGLVTFLAAAAPFTFIPALALAFAAAVTAGLTTALALGLDGLSGFLATFAAGLAAVLDFLICAFTACLLWEAAPWYARA